MDPAPPGEWHPWYARGGFVEAWLEDDRRREPIRIPVLMSVVRFYGDPDPPMVEPTLPCRVLTKRMAAGPAPYVGCAFSYWWWAGKDDLGRQVASTARRHYFCDCHPRWSFED